MKLITLSFASIYGALSVVLGALGAHAFRNILTADKLSSFETGVKYQMYHAIVLLVLGLTLSFTSNLEKWAAISIIIGVFLFSFSIYFLAFASHWDVNLKFLGPITPLGGIALIVGWSLLLCAFIKGFK